MMASTRLPARHAPVLRLAGALVVGGPLFAACTVFVQNQVNECHEHADCLAFPGAICDKEQNLCVPGSSAASGMGGSGAGTGPGGGGGMTTTSGTGGAGGNTGSACDIPSKPTAEITGEITGNFTLSNTQDYILKGKVYVTPGVTLTIEKCTTIRGEPTTDITQAAALVVQPGAKLIAVGTADEPIVFTSNNPPGSRKAGDWGGVILLGNARTNIVNMSGMPITGNIEGIPAPYGTYGGINDDDTSGTLKYVRIEYGGTLIAPNNEINGLTFGGVGRNTIVDYVQVRHALDDCFEFFGGTVNAKHLACQYNQDDGFDWDNGYSGKLQFLVLQQDPVFPDETNGFEGDNEPASPYDHAPLSNPTIYNATLCGKNADVDKPQFGMLLRHGTQGRIYNTIVTGFEAGIDIKDVPPTSVTIESSIFFSNLVANLAYVEVAMGTGVFADDDGGLDEVAFLLDPMKNNSEADPGIPKCFDADAPDFSPATSLTMGAATPPDDGFFDATAGYIGAFRDASDRWATTGRWAVWSAQ